MSSDTRNLCLSTPKFMTETVINWYIEFCSTSSHLIPIIVDKETEPHSQFIRWLTFKVSLYRPWNICVSVNVLPGTHHSILSLFNLVLEVDIWYHTCFYLQDNDVTGGSLCILPWQNVSSEILHIRSLSPHVIIGSETYQTVTRIIIKVGYFLRFSFHLPTCLRLFRTDIWFHFSSKPGLLQFLQLIVVIITKLTESIISIYSFFLDTFTLTLCILIKINVCYTNTW